MTDRVQDVAGLSPEAFRARFGIGAAGEGVHPVDIAGVALASLQGLRELVVAQEAALAALRARVEEAEGRLRSGREEADAE